MRMLVHAINQRFVAKADDPSAIVLNPAGLGWVKGVQVTFDNNILATEEPAT